MRMTVADLMCETPVTIGPDSSTEDALDAFYEYEAAELYVVDKTGKLLGILPDYELLKVELSGEARGACVHQLMSRSAPTVTPETDAADVARLFRAGYCSRLPVLKDGKLIGVVTRADVLRLMAVFQRMERESKKTRTGPKRPKILQDRSLAEAHTVQIKTPESEKPATNRRTRAVSRTSATRLGR